MDNSREKFEAKFPVPLGAAFADHINEYVFVGGVHHMQRCREYQEKWLVWQARDAEIEAARKEGFATGLQAAVDAVEYKKFEDKNPVSIVRMFSELQEAIKQLEPTNYKVVKAEEYVAPDYQLRVCLCGSHDVGAGNGSAGCYKCGKSVNGITTETAVKKWNELNAPATAINTERIEALLSLIKVAQCPNHCINGAIQISETDIQQCQWCFERDNAIKEGVNNHD